ncbi:hypothetical protein GY45DRAFT_1266256 [Cubamyces sp. BRFM 1775]|nr:hypothetical protein GY45DRAFT_1266256 [Cubamyces sp. BRFM 1775]
MVTGTSGDESRNDESQASQLLAAVLKPREPREGGSRAYSSAEPNAAEGSLPSSGGNSIHYHLNGLMPTQTQSPYSTQDPPRAGDSQKENDPSPPAQAKTPPPIPGRDIPRPPLRSPPAEALVPIKGGKEKSCPKDLAPASRDAPTSLKDDKAVPVVSLSRPASRFQVPAGRPATLNSRQMPPPRGPRSPSPASQDSFADPPPRKDPARVILEKSDVFRIPLSRLGEDSQPLSEGEDGPPPISSNMWASRDNTARSSSPAGNVLVAGTPSNSSRSNDSQSQSQSQARRSQSCYAESQLSEGDTQLSDLIPPGQGQSIEAEMAEFARHHTFDTDHEDAYPSQRSHSDLSTEPSSSYERIANQDPFEPIPEATQPAVDETMDETQAVDYSKPSHETDPSSIVRNHDFWNENGQIVFPSVPSEKSRTSDATRSTIPRGLLGLVAPHKRYRYQDILAGTPATAGPSNERAGRGVLEETQDPDMSLPTTIAPDETQPSDLSAMFQTPLATAPKRTLPTATRMLQSLKSRQHSARTDVVPDSEESRIIPDSDPPIPPSTSPAANPPTAQSSPTKPRSRKGLQSEDEVLRTVMESTAPSVQTIQEEEEDEEDDVPLAAAVMSAKAKGKQKAIEPPSSPAAKSTKSPRKLGLAQKSTSWRDAVIPSSDPQERREEVAQPKSAKQKTPLGQIVPALNNRSAPRQAKLAARGRLHESSDEDSPDEDDDKDTLPAEDQMDVDPPAPPAKAARGGKRKRTVSTSTRKNSANSTVAKVKEEASTPATRPAKRLKSASNARMGSGVATRVFALWKQDGHYYSGTVHALAGPGRYDVRFDDGDTAQVEVKHLRACRLRKGDNVLLSGKTKAVVVKAPSTSSGLQATDKVDLELDDDGEETLDVQSIRLAPRTVTSEWADRMLTEDMISPLIKPKVSRVSPTPSVAVSEGSVRGARKPLNKTGLVITWSPQGAGEERNALVAEIRQNGGVVLDDWSALYTLSGDLANKGQRWCLTQEDIKWKERNDVDRAFLISDDNNHKPKFLIALALGIPCLSIDWLKSVVRERKDLDWQPYLLPAGFSDHSNARVSQLVDLDWGNSIQHLTEITANLVPPKVFAGKSILCVSPQFVPCRQKGKKKGNGVTQSSESVPLIILCMGAAAVEAVTDEKHASGKIDEYDYVVVRDEQDYERLEHVERCVDVNWVKDCLISGRLLATPKTQVESP